MSEESHCTGARPSSSYKPKYPQRCAGLGCHLQHGLQVPGWVVKRMSQASSVSRSRLHPRSPPDKSKAAAPQGLTVRVGAGFRLEPSVSEVFPNLSLRSLLRGDKQAGRDNRSHDALGAGSPGQRSSSGSLRYRLCVSFWLHG